MLFSKSIVIAIVASCVFFQLIQMNSADIFTVDQIVGAWYTMGVYSPEINISNVVDCYQINITKISNDEQSFRKDVRIALNGSIYDYYAYGKVENAEIKLWSPGYENEKSCYSVTSYENGQELIIRDKEKSRSHAIITREPHIRTKTRREFEKLGALETLRYFKNLNCE